MTLGNLQEFAFINCLREIDTYLLKYIRTNHFNSMSDRNRVVFTDGNEEEIIETEISQRNPNTGLKNGII